MRLCFIVMGRRPSSENIFTYCCMYFTASPIKPKRNCVSNGASTNVDDDVVDGLSES